MPLFLAHGALGWYDELIFLGVLVIFLTMMGISWFRSRDLEFSDDDLMPQSPQKAPDEEERFELE